MPTEAIRPTSRAMRLVTWLHSLPQFTWRVDVRRCRVRSSAGRGPACRSPAGKTLTTRFTCATHRGDERKSGPGAPATSAGGRGLLPRVHGPDHETVPGAIPREFQPGAFLLGRIRAHTAAGPTSRTGIGLRSTDRRGSGGDRRIRYDDGRVT